MSAIEPRHVRLEPLHIYVKGLVLPDSIDGIIYPSALPAPVEPLQDLFRFEPDERDASAFNLLPFLLATSRFDISSATSLLGEAYLFTFSVADGQLALALAANCRVSAIE